MSATRSIPRFTAVAALLAIAFTNARAELGSPDASWREAQLVLREAGRDTVGRSDDPARLDALGTALLRMARLPDAERIFRRALAVRPDDREALAGLGRIALCTQRDALAESLLTRAGDAEGASADLYRARLRRHVRAAAAAMAETQGEAGRSEMLARLAALPPRTRLEGPERAAIPFQRAWPVPLVRVKLNGQLVVMAVDPGATDLLLDPSATRVCRVTVVPGERTVAWSGVRLAARNAIVQKLDLGGFALADVPAAVTPLHRYSLDANPGAPDLAGVIGLPVLERFGVTIDFPGQVLELRRPEAPVSAHGERVPFERWGENELMVYGSIADGRRMAMWVGTGLPDAGIGASRETFDELGVQPGKVANIVHGAGSLLQGRAWSQVMVSTVAVGPIACGRVPGWSGAMEPGELWRWGVRRDAVLGPRFFAGRRVTFDWARRELVFEDSLDN
jgi:hypothetical protein